MQIQFLGAARTVTGSCYLVESRGLNILVDCGMFQGADVEKLNYESFSFDPKTIHAVILTHSHLDHCGLIPKLYRHGFRGKVYMTPPTRQIVELMLLDSAKVQNIRYQAGRKAKYKGYRLAPYEAAKVSSEKPIYDTTDVLGVVRGFESVHFGKSTKISKNIEFKFMRSGHALGAASALVRVNEGGSNKSVLFSGDIGNPNQNLDTRFSYAKKADYVVMESLYGGRHHADRGEDMNTMKKHLAETLERGGNVVIPAFTYQRSQEMIYLLHSFFDKGELPSEAKVYLDSPLAIKVTDVYKKYYTYLDEIIANTHTSGDHVFNFSNLVSLANNRDSIKIRKKKGSILIAGHGMCVGGRVIYHLIENLPDPNATVLFVGYQAEGTLGREIVEGAKEVMIEGHKIVIRANIVRLGSFSAHADHDDLMNWLGHVNKKSLKKVFLVHSEESIGKEFQQFLTDEDYDAIVPKMKDVYTLSN